jgi:hypothetical protein
MFRPTPESIILQVEQNASPNKADTVLTWPEGNARLAHHLQKYVAGKSLKNHLYNIKIEENKAVATVLIIKPKHQLPLLQIK